MSFFKDAIGLYMPRCSRAKIDTKDIDCFLYQLWNEGWTLPKHQNGGLISKSGQDIDDELAVLTTIGSITG